MVGSFGFAGDPKIYQTSVSENIVRNIRYWLDVSFLELGAYTNISLNEQNFDYEDISQLKPVSDRVFLDGQVYQSKFKNWVWESGISYKFSTTDPTICSGIYIGGDFHPRGCSGDMSYHVDFKNGRVIFDNAYAPNTYYGSGSVPVCAQFSYKNIYIATQSELVKTLVESEETNPIGSGEDVMTEDKIPFPAVIVRKGPNEWEPYQLGGNKIYTGIMYGEVFDTTDIGQNVVDILSQQRDKKIPSIDWNLCESPFDEYGDINTAFSGIYEISTIYGWKHIYLKDTSSVTQNGSERIGTINFFIEAEPFA